MDECDLHTHPHLAKVGQRRGQPVTVAAAGKDQRRVAFGTLDYASGHLTWLVDEHKSGDIFATFLAQVAAMWPDDDLLLVMDNVSYHRSPPVRAWWAAQDGRVIPFWLPVDTPNLNLIERVWWFLKQKLACHRLGNDVDGLTTAAATLLDHLEAHFHTVDSPAIRLVTNLCETA